jgi:aspartate aminotransferase
MALYRRIVKPPVDFMNILKHKANADTHPDKVDLGVGVHRNEEGQYYEFSAIKKVCITL